MSFQWSTDGKKLILVDFRDVIVCDMEQETEIVLRQPADVMCASLNPDGCLLAIGTRHEIRFWEMEAGRQQLSFRTEPMTHLLWHASGEYLAGGDEDGTVSVISQNGQVQWELQQSGAARDLGLSDSVSCLSWSPVQCVLAFAAGLCTTFQVFDATRGQMAWKSPGLGPFQDITWNRDGTKLVVACSDQSVHLLHATRGEVLCSLELSGVVNSLTWST